MNKLQKYFKKYIEVVGSNRFQTLQQSNQNVSKINVIELQAPKIKKSSDILERFIRNF